MTIMAPAAAPSLADIAPKRATAVTYEFRVSSPEAERTSIGQVLRQTWRHSLALTAVAVVVAQFLVLPLVQQRAQVAAGRELQARFAVAAGSIGHSDLSPLPTEPPALGSAIALLQIPKLGLEQVVIEGASGATTVTGPGHVSGTAGIGERGTSVIAGHRSTAGAPFARLNHLAIGDRFSAVTVAGPMQYEVVSIGTQAPDLAADTSGRARLVLATSSPAGLGARDLFVVAESTAPAYPSTPQNRLPDSGLRSIDFGALASVAAWLLLLLGFATLARFWLRARLMDRMICWTVAAPVLTFIGFMLARALAAFLPPTL